MLWFCRSLDSHLALLHSSLYHLFRLIFCLCTWSLLSLFGLFSVSSLFSASGSVWLHVCVTYLSLLAFCRYPVWFLISVFTDLSVTYAFVLAGFCPGDFSVFCCRCLLFVLSDECPLLCQPSLPPPCASVSVLLGLGFSTWFYRSMLFSCVSRFVFVLQGPLLIFFVYVIDVEAADVACLHSVLCPYLHLFVCICSCRFGFLLHACTCHLLSLS